MSDQEGLQEWLQCNGFTNAEVSNLAVSTAGARRRNVLFDVRVPGGESRRLVATILPTAGIALLSMADEAAVREAARTKGVPVPEVLGVCTDDSYVGGAFFVSACVDGETIPRRLLRVVDEHRLGDTVVSQLGTAMARLHDVDAATVRGGLARPPAPVAAALDGVQMAATTLLQCEPAFDYGIRWLVAHTPPEPQRNTLVHADIRTGNIIVGSDGLRAILDWETSKVGDPMEDLAWVCTRMWRFGRDHLAVGGLGKVAALRDAYVAAGGQWSDERFLWWRVLTTLRWGFGLAAQAAAHLDGTYSTVVMAASGRRVAEMAFDTLTLVAPGADPFS